MPSWKVDLSERRSIRAQVTWLSKSPCRSDGFIGTTHRQSDWLTDWILFDSIRSRVVERIFGRARCHWVVYRVAAPHKRATLLIDGPNIIIRFKWLHALLTAVRDSNGGVSRSSNAEMILLPLYWSTSLSFYHRLAAYPTCTRFTFIFFHSIFLLLLLLLFPSLLISRASVRKSI